MDFLRSNYFHPKNKNNQHKKWSPFSYKFSSDKSKILGMPLPLTDVAAQK